MFSRKQRSAVWVFMCVVAGMAALCGGAFAQTRERLLIPVGRAEVVTTPDDVRTVAIAEPKIADAAVGSARTVVVNAKSAGVTTLVVYAENARFKVYDVECFVPNAAKQVALHVRIAEVNDRASRELGFDYYADGTTGNGNFLTGGLMTTKISPYSKEDTPISIVNPPGLTVGPATTDGFFGLTRGNGTAVIHATWKALEQTGDLRTLATPTLVTRSGQKATFLAGGELAVPIASAATAGATNVTIEWKEFGVKLDFTPTVQEDNSITLDVAPEHSALDYSNPLALSGFVVPNLVTRKASTVVNMNSGEFLAIGGLKQTDQIKVVRRLPILGRIPLLGFFFTNTRTESVTKDLLVVVSPEIVEVAASTLPALPTDRPQK